MTELASPKTRSQSDPLAEWAVSRIRLEGRPFRFDGHKYLRAIYNDTSPHVVLSKAAQIGGSTWSILRSVHACMNGLNVMYLFPNRSDVLDFSRSRVSPLLADNPFLLRLMNDTDTAGLKKIGDAYLYLRGMKSSVGLKSVPADMIVFDELDEATPEARTMAKERIAHSDYKRIIELSNPSLPDYGIDEQYQKSDQRHWHMKCPACGAWTALDKEFPLKLNQEVRVLLLRADGSVYRACVKCSAELDPDVGEWVADFPDREIHGYRISQLFSSKVDPAEILQEYRNTHYPERFYNLKIGVPWADLEHRLDIMSVLSLCSDQDFPEPKKVRKHYAFMGVDTGRQLHVVILYQPTTYYKERLDVAYLGVHHDFSELDGLMERYGITQCVIDGLPEIHATRAFAKRNYGRVYLSFFNENQRGSANWDREQWKVEVNRTEALDASRAVIRERQIVLPRRLPIIEEFARHMAADAKVLDEDPDTGAMKYRYIRTGGPDHYSLAFTYALLASERYRFYGPPVIFL